jgi:transposase
MDMQDSTLIALCWELHEQGIPKTRIAQRLGRHRETIHLWIKGIEQCGLLGFLDKHEQAKKGERRSRQVDPIVKRLVWQLREREFHCCGQKIQYFLKLEHGIHLSVPKIYEILAEKYVIRSRWRKNRERGPIPQASTPREVVQMDSMDFGGIYAFHRSRYLHQRGRHSLGSGTDSEAWGQVPVSEHEEAIWRACASDTD